MFERGSCSRIGWLAARLERAGRKDLRLTLDKCLEVDDTCLMSKLTDDIRELGVYNSHEFYNGNAPEGQVYISWRGSDGRSPIGYDWIVHRVGYKTDPGGAWYNYDNKVFAGYGGREGKAKALAEAQEWAGKRYGITEWKRDPFGTFGSAGFIKQRIAELKDAVEKAVAQ